jgi:hypothetical protein
MSRHASSCLTLVLASIVLPKTLADQKIRFFKFWFNHQLQDGLHYQNELFYCLQSLKSGRRPQLCRLGKQLASQGADILITSHRNHDSLWVSLRSPPRILGQLQQPIKRLPVQLSLPPQTASDRSAVATENFQKI